MRTLLESTDIRILPQHRFKVPKTNLIPAIFFYNGSFVPIHVGHLDVLEAAKHYIDQLGTHEVLAAYISPSHAGYIAKKLKPEELIGTGHRLSMIHLAIENIDWVMVDLFEIFQPCSTKLSVIMKAFLLRVHSQIPCGIRVDVFWLRGEDALRQTKSPDNFIQLGFDTIYVLNRGCHENTTNSDSNGFGTIQESHEKRWKEIRASSSFPEKYRF